MSGAMGGFLSGMAAGYGTVMNFQRDKDDRESQREQRDNARKDRAELDSLRTDLKEAGKDVGVDQTWRPANDDEGNAMPQAPATFAVNGASFGTDRAAADAAAVKANTGAARAARIAGVYDAHGMAKEGAELRHTAQQQDIGAIQLDEAQRKHVNQLFDDSLAGMTSHDAIAQMVTNSKHDGEGGGLQVKAVPSQDGKSVEYQRVMPDGTTQPTGLTFSNDTRGLENAKAYLSKNVNAHDKLNNLHQLEMERLQAQQNANTATHQQGMLGVAQQNANTQEQWRKDQAAHLGAMEGIAKDKADATGTSKMSPDDAVAYKSLDSERANLAGLINKAKAEGTWSGTPEQKQLETQLAAIGIRQRDLLGQYGNQGRQSDPLGMRTPAAAAGTQPPAKATPAAPAPATPAPIAAQGIPAAVVGQPPAAVSPAAGGRDYSAMSNYDFGASSEAQKQPEKVGRRSGGERYTWNGNDYPTLDAANKARDAQLKKK